jgi:ankyrin repeat protein
MAPLHCMCNGHTEIGIALIEKGADVNAKTIRGSTPLHLAC